MQDQHQLYTEHESRWNDDLLVFGFTCMFLSLSKEWWKVWTVTFVFILVGLHMWCFQYITKFTIPPLSLLTTIIFPLPSSFFVFFLASCCIYNLRNCSLNIICCLVSKPSENKYIYENHLKTRLYNSHVSILIQRYAFVLYFPWVFSHYFTIPF